MTTVHALNHYALDPVGHFFGYYQTIQKIVEENQLTHRAYVREDIQFDPLPPTWERFFVPFNQKRGMGAFFQKSLSLFRSAEGEERLFFIDHFLWFDFWRLAVAALLKGRKGDRFWLMDRGTYWSFPVVKKRGRLYYALIRSLKKKFGEGFLLMTDSALMQTFYQKRFGITAYLLPIPLGVQRDFPAFCPKEQLKCIWPGGPREEKGLATIQKLLTIDDPHTSKIELHLSEATPLPPKVNALKLKFFDRILSNEGYAKHLQACDVSLLPYDPKAYANRTSGIFVETIVAGKIPLVRDQTWHAYELRRFGLEALIVDWENPLFFSHLTTLAGDPAIHERLRVMHGDYCQFHSGENFRKVFSNALSM